MKRNYTKRALIAVLAPIGYGLIAVLLVLIATMLEQSTGSGGLYVAFAMLSLLQLVSFPFVCAGCDITGIVFACKALKKGEPKWKNILILFFAALSIAAAVCLTLRFWQGAMSV